MGLRCLDSGFWGVFDRLDSCTSRLGAIPVLLLGSHTDLLRGPQDLVSRV